MNRSIEHLSTGTRIRVAFYAIAAVFGAVLTARFNAQWSSQRGGFDVAEYVRAGFENSAASSFGVDLIVAAVVGLVFMIGEGRRLRIRSTALFVVTTFVLAFAFSFPAFLAVRELRIARMGSLNP